MIKHNLRIFSQNIRKNKVLTDIILETQKNSADIVFIQEPSRFLIWHIPSHTNPLVDPLYGTPTTLNRHFSFTKICYRTTMQELLHTSINNFWGWGLPYASILSITVERVQKGIAHWDKQNNDVPAPNCMLKVWGEIIKDEGYK